VAGDPQQPVPLADLEVAQRIAAAARSGSRGDREPTIEQLLDAFGEPVPTPEARTRVASALTLAGVRAQPTLHEAHPGERIALRQPGVSRRPRALLATLLLVLVAGGAATAAALSTGGGGNDAPSAAAPDTVTQQTATAPPVSTATPPPATTPAPAKGKGKKAKKNKKRAKKKAKPRPKVVVVKLVPGPQASYLCVDRGPGTPATETTLSAPQTFRGKRIRINVGLSSVIVTVNGKPFALSGSPTGYDIGVNQRSYLPQGRRPCA
jgi:hypothetical protein